MGSITKIGRMTAIGSVKDFDKNAWVKIPMTTKTQELDSSNIVELCEGNICLVENGRVIVEGVLTLNKPSSMILRISRFDNTDTLITDSVVEIEKNRARNFRYSYTSEYVDGDYILIDMFITKGKSSEVTNTVVIESISSESSQSVTSNSDSSGVGSLVGTKVECEPGRTEADGLIPLIDGYTIENGVALYPEFAAKYPSFTHVDPQTFRVDLKVPVGWNGAVTRNLGGNANAFAVPQSDAIKAHTHNYTRYASIPTNSSTGGNNGRWRGTQNSTSSSTGDVETRMKNVGLQAYLRLDNF